MVLTRKVALRSQGHTDIIDITNQVAEEIRRSGLKAGIVTIFVPGATGGLTTIEYEPGLVHDLKQAFERIAPYDMEYRHHMRWGDDNGASHVRASLLGPSLTVPFAERELLLGTWQQVIFIDFDTRPRSRELILQIIGE
ncbi:MAG: secondary thiamine-phosphate synthase enzyme YjbQ [Anaerolineae bacterium]